MEVMRSPLVSIIVPNYNGIGHLRTFLASIEKTRYPNMEVIIVDNGSTDGCVDMIRDNFPDVRVIENEMNLGTAIGYNMGIRVSKGKYVSLLSNDMEVDPDWLHPLVGVLERRNDVAAVDGWFLDYYDRKRFDTVAAGGRYVDHFGNVRALGACESHENRNREIRRIFAAVALIRKEVFDEVGLFDPDFFFGYEDIDLFWRVNLAGHKTLCVPSSVIYHKSGASSRRGEKRMPGFYYLEKRNRLISIMKNLPWTNLALALPVILLEYLSYLAFWIVKRNRQNVTELIGSLGWFSRRRNIRHVLEKRRQVHSDRSVPPVSLRVFLVPYCGDLLNLVGRGRGKWRDYSEICQDGKKHDA